MNLKLFDSAIEHLTRGLTFTAKRHDLLTQNVANIETPGYKARDLVFDDHLRPLLAAATPAPGEPMPPVGTDGRTPRTVFANDAVAKPNGNDVSLDRQMARLAENTLFHSALTQILTNQFNQLKQAISGRV